MYTWSILSGLSTSGPGFITVLLGLLRIPELYLSQDWCAPLSQCFEYLHWDKGGFVLAKVLSQSVYDHAVYKKPDASTDNIRFKSDAYSITDV